MERRNFEKIVLEALENMPGVFRRRIENVDFIVEDRPTAEQAKFVDNPAGIMILGMYQGVPLSKRGQFYGMVMPDKITIFKRNVEKICKTEEEIRRTIFHTVQHELAHYFGISDDELRRSGTY
ncbi:MAG: metallopeptidase family protein [Candidatus Omnitrophota bacterium]